ncbi:hypothetical protein [Magnetofaba australis]|uniref:Uncharacterized protein n=1 Tax=Magnetofaba australis IT-1 TaxID=1434232 RepID=A0A1Y2K596_9PROT|nr:hypothetical protein [Magnetofaba australis]OSM04429.1 hypothetical protein MAIT1_04341 [Magnetofaba australis IT-1]
MKASKRETALALLFGGALLIPYQMIFGALIPNASGKLGHDHTGFIPAMLDGYNWFSVNGLFSVPWFTPAFCGGLPAFPHPQNGYFSIPQWLAFFVDPLTVLQITLLLFAYLGYVGMWLLLRDSFKTSPMAALLGATLFAFNGFFAYRLAIGHVLFHPIMLTPLAAFLLLRAVNTGGRLATAGWLSGAALLLAYGMISGMGSLMPAMAFALLLTTALHMQQTHWRARPLLIWAGVCVLAVAISAAKIVASFAFLSQFPRVDYLLPGFRTILMGLDLLVRSLFWTPPDLQTINHYMDNRTWGLERHEFEYGLSLVPLIILAIVALLWLRQRPWSKDWSRPKTHSIVLALLILFPFAINTFEPHWNAFLKSLPVLGSSSFLGRWLVIYTVLVAMAAAWAFDALPWRNKALPWLALALCVGGVIAQNALTDKQHYQAQGYDPTAVVKEYNAVKQREDYAPQIEALLMYRDGAGRPLLHANRNDSLIVRQSPILCYEPIFGYRLGRFPWRPLRPGPADMSFEKNIFNFKNPACYVYPDENQCKPGDHFRLDQHAQLMKLLRYHPYEFEMSTAQKIANVVSLAALAGAMLCLLANLVVGIMPSGFRGTRHLGK